MIRWTPLLFRTLDADGKPIIRDVGREVTAGVSRWIISVTKVFDKTMRTRESMHPDCSVC